MTRAKENTLLPNGDIEIDMPAGMVPAEMLKDMPLATLALLRDAWKRVQEQEQIIEAQNKRIKELEDLASTDPLTGLMNRRGLSDFFEQELSRIQREHSEGALLLLIDLDKFKQLNDTHGHQAGDACLKIVSEEIMDSIRFTDGAARLGGDEFAILLTQTDAKKAADRVNLIRDRLGNGINFEFNGVALCCSGSVGVTTVAKQDGDFADCYERADKALYAEKARRKGAPALFA